MASTTAWIRATGMLGSKIRTLGPRSGSVEECRARAGAACAVAVAETVAAAVSRATRRTRCRRRLGVRVRTGDRDIDVTHLPDSRTLLCAPNHGGTRGTRRQEKDRIAAGAALAGEGFVASPRFEMLPRGYRGCGGGCPFRR